MKNFYLRCLGVLLVAMAYCSSTKAESLNLTIYCNNPNLIDWSGQVCVKNNWTSTKLESYTIEFGTTPEASGTYKGYYKCTKTLTCQTASLSSNQRKTTLIANPKSGNYIASITGGYTFNSTATNQSQTLFSQYVSSNTSKTYVVDVYPGVQRANSNPTSVSLTVDNEDPSNTEIIWNGNGTDTNITSNNTYNKQRAWTSTVTSGTYINGDFDNTLTIRSTNPNSVVSYYLYRGDFSDITNVEVLAEGAASTVSSTIKTWNTADEDLDGVKLMVLVSTPPADALETDVTVVCDDPDDVAYVAYGAGATGFTTTSASHKASADGEEVVYRLYANTSDPTASVVTWFYDSQLTNAAAVTNVGEYSDFVVTASLAEGKHLTLYPKFAKEVKYTVPLQVTYQGASLAGIVDVEASDEISSPVEVSAITNDFATYTFTIPEVRFGVVKLSNIIFTGVTSTTNADGTKTFNLQERRAKIGTVDIDSDNSTVQNLASSAKEQIEKDGLMMKVSGKLDEANGKLSFKAETSSDIVVKIAILGNQNLKKVKIYFGSDDLQPEISDMAGEYLFYNVSTGKWLQPNNTEWTDAYHRQDRDDPYLILGNQGFVFRIENRDGGGYKIASSFSGYLDTNRNDFYLDRPDRAAWTFNRIADLGNGIFACRIRNPFGDLGINTENNIEYYISPTNEFTNVDHKIQWIAVPKAMRAQLINTNFSELINNAEYQQAYQGISFPDATFMVKGYDFDKNNTATSAWKDTPQQGNINRNGGSGKNAVFETWNKTNVDVYQTVTGLPLGMYKVTMEAAYSPTGQDGVTADTYTTYGTTSHAKIYAGDKSTPIHSFYAHIQSSQGNGYNTDLGDGQWVGKSVGDFSDIFRHTNDFLLELNDVMVLDGTLRLGAKIENGTGDRDGSWIILDKVHLTYTGELPIETLRQGLNDIIAEANTYKAADYDYTWTALQQALDGALATAETAAAGSNATAMVDAALALRTALDAAKAVNTKALREAANFMTSSNAAFASAEAYQPVAALLSAQTASQSEIDEARDVVIRGFKLFSMTKSPVPTHYSEVSNSVVGKDDNEYGVEGDYYIYNVGTGGWLQGGNNWGTHDAVGFPGVECSTPHNDYDDGHYNSIVTHLYNGDWGNGGQLGHNGYTDTGGNGWKFWRVPGKPGVYTIARNGRNHANDGGLWNDEQQFGNCWLLGYTGKRGWYDCVDTDCAPFDNENNQWMFVTKADRIAEAAGADYDNPGDLTFLIKQPGFNVRDRKAGTNQNGEQLDWKLEYKKNGTWTENAEGDYTYFDSDRHIIPSRGGDENHGDYCVDIYNQPSFSLTQTIEGLTPGFYRVKVQGYYNKPERHAYLIANGETKPLMYMQDAPVVPWVGRYADNTWEAIETFQAGLYWNEVECLVDIDGKLNFGVMKDEHITGDCFLFDNFRLEFLGSAIRLAESQDNTDRIAAVKGTSIQTVKVQRTLADGKWNTIALPFSLNETQVKSAFGSEAKVAELTGLTNYIEFSSSTTIEAGKPYLVLVKGDRQEGDLIFKNVTITNETESVTQSNDDESVTFVPNPYAQANIGTKAWFVTGNNTLKQNASGTSLKPFRAYFNLDNEVTAAKLFRIDAADDDDPDGIITIKADGTVGDIYTIDGKQVKKTADKGVYIINGKKTMVK